MIPDALLKYNITFEEAKKDSPQFRENVNLFARDLDDTINWIHSLKPQKEAIVHAFNKQSLSLKMLSDQFRKKLGVINCGITNAIAEAIQTIASVQKRMLDVSLQKPLDNSLLESLEEIKLLKKAYDKQLSKYDRALLSWTAMAKTTENVGEAYKVLNLTRQQYFLESSRMVHKICLLRYTILPYIGVTTKTIFSDYELLLQEISQVIKGILASTGQLEKSLRSVNIEAEKKIISELQKKMLDDVLLLQRQSTADLLQVSPAEKNESADCKEGYLFQKIDKTWVRRYFFIENGKFRALGAPLIEISILLCSPKYDFQDDRRFCLEIYTPDQEYLLQAENEGDLRSWLSAINYSKNKELMTPTIELPQALSVKSLDDGLLSQENIQIDVQLEVVGSERSNNSLNKTFTYADPNLEKRDVDLHRLIPTLSSSEHALYTFSASLQKESLIQGKCFLTQNTICFHSNVLGFVTILVIHMKDVMDISRKEESSNAVIEIATASQKLHFKTYISAEKSFQITKMLWENTKQKMPTEIPELLEKISGSNIAASNEQLSFKIADIGPDSTEASTSSDGELSCGCYEHYERMEADTILDGSIQDVYDYLWGAKSKEFWDYLDKINGVTNRVDSGWSNDALPSKKVSFKLPVSASMIKMKDLEIIDRLKFIRKNEKLCYVVETVSSATGVPLGDSFETLNRYCVTFISDKRCRLKVSIGFNFLKSTMMKGMIKAGGFKGFSENFAGIQAHLIARLSGQLFDSTASTENSGAGVLADGDEAPVSCPCTSHFEKTDVDQTLPIPASLAYKVLFGTHEQSFWSQVDSKNNTTKRIFKPFENNKRTLTFTVPINNPMVKAKELDVVSNHELLTCDENNCYVVTFRNATPNAPYGDAFTTETKFCITKLTSKSCKILITNGINFTKSVLVKGIIKSNGLKGLADSASLIIDTLIQHEEVKKFVPKDQVIAVAPIKDDKKSSESTNWILILSIASVAILTILGLLFGTPFSIFKSKPDILDLKSPVMALEKGISRSQLQEFYQVSFNNSIPNSGSHLNNAALVQTHLDLGREYLKTQALKSDLDFKRGLVDGMENHLLWALYLNYEENRLLNCKDAGLVNC